MAYAQVSSLDYADIRAALVEYLRRNTDFTDYDFEASTLSSVIDLLAYNTYYTAFNTTMAVNESFLASASLRDNIVNIAKQLGYTAKSRTAASASLELKVDFTSVAAIDQRLVPKFLTLKKGNCFVASNVDNRSETYQFAVLEDVVSPIINNICYISNTVDNDNLKIQEGTYLTFTFIVDKTIPNQKFIIPTEHIDSETIKVSVRENANSSSLEQFEKVPNILDVTADDAAFFVQEVTDRRYELIFGDGVLGKALKDGQVIQVSYLATSGKNANDIKNFVFSGEIYDENSARVLNNIGVTVKSGSAGGDDIEPTELVQTNAPKFYAAQNRAVTLDDYKIITQRLYSSIADIIVYGGETEEPPEYGRVKIAIKPKYSDILSNSTKTDILSKLKKYTVASVTPVIVDPSIVDVLVQSKIFYNQTQTNSTTEQLRNLVISNLDEYDETADLSKFGGVIRKSKVTTVIDSSQDSITGNNTEFRLRKKLVPALNTRAQYLLCYVNPFKSYCDGQSTITSTKFKISGFSEEAYLENTEDGTIRIYTIDPITARKRILVDDVGTVNFDDGKVTLSSLTITEGSDADNNIYITAVPKNDDIFAVREVYLNLALQDSTFSVFKEVA
jgi:hypothetical protein|tara:strand:- start:3213 stop:5063 length:1851 start_codon:yes stop_codon:yes gene_type:complete